MASTTLSAFATINDQRAFPRRCIDFEHICNQNDVSTAHDLIRLLSAHIASRLISANDKHPAASCSSITEAYICRAGPHTLS